MSEELGHQLHDGYLRGSWLLVLLRFPFSRTLTAALGAKNHVSVNTRSTVQRRKFDLAAAQIRLELMPHFVRNCTSKKHSRKSVATRHFSGTPV